MSNRPLTPKRLFADPPLLPALPTAAKFGKDDAGQFIAYLCGSETQRDHLELWRYDTATPQPVAG